MIITDFLLHKLECYLIQLRLITKFGGSGGFLSEVIIEKGYWNNINQIIGWNTDKKGGFSDYKVFSSVLASRQKRFWGKFIREDQCVFYLKGSKKITWELLYVVEYIQQNDEKQVALIFLDALDILN